MSGDEVQSLDEVLRRPVKNAHVPVTFADLRRRLQCGREDAVIVEGECVDVTDRQLGAPPVQRARRRRG